jgi:hypothetical protein
MHMPFVERGPITNTLADKGQNKGGWIEEGLIAALFVGLAFFILLFSWIPAVFSHLQILGYIGTAVLVVLMMIITYSGVAAYRHRRFQQGGRDYLQIRKYMEACIAKDCREIEDLFSNSNNSNILIFNKMLLCWLQYFLDHEGLRARDSHKRFKKSRLKRMNGVHFENFFMSPKEYDNKALPYEFSIVLKALNSSKARLKIQLFQLEKCRRDLFTNMSDYLDIFYVTEEEIVKLQGIYRYNPPRYDGARKIVFANKIIDYLKKDHQNKLSDEQRLIMEEIAMKKISQLKNGVADYRNAWKNIVKVYERLPLD